VTDKNVYIHSAD